MKKIYYHLRLSNKEGIKKCLIENCNIIKRCEYVDEPCWEWNRFASVQGYGIIRIYGEEFKTHRISKYVFDDFDLNSKLFICHICDNKICINPSHLFIGTHEDNMRDMHRKGRHKPVRGENQPNSKLELSDFEEIIFMRKNGATYKEIGEKFGVAGQIINSIFLGKSWKHLKLPIEEIPKCEHRNNY